MSEAKGARFNAGKWKPTFWPREALKAGSRVWEFGEAKYARDNWRGGLLWTEVADSTIRHLQDFLDPSKSDFDKESGLHVVWHALCNVAMLTWFIRYRPECDDRWKGEFVAVAKEQDDACDARFRDPQYSP